MAASTIPDQSTRVVWVTLGCTIIAAGVGAEVILFDLDVFDIWPFAFHGPFWLWALLTLCLAATTRFAAWVLLFGWVVMFVWAVLVAMATGLDALLLPPALVYLVVPAAAFLGQAPRAANRTP